ncbi:MAG: repeat-containing protein YrrB [Caulobacteraceae bacterium]|nr:repeat-containing protein YrrB [Caulobacteraceae bacterium]
MRAPQSLPEAIDVALDPAEILKRALDHHRAGERDEAESLYRRILEADPREPTALYLYGLFNMETGQVEVAERLLSQLVEVRPGNAEAHVALANLTYGRGRHEQAIAGYREALAIQPGHPVALVNLASILLERGFVDDGDFDGAIDVCRAAIALLADPAPAHTVLGRILLAAGRIDEAAEAYRAAVARSPANLAALAGLALALIGGGDGEAALGAADTALALDPDCLDACHARGSALLVLHQPKAAARAFEHGVALAPAQARMHLGLGDAYAELDRTHEALKHYWRAAELEPASKSAHANLGSVLYRCGDLENAERHCRLALAADPNMVVVHQNLAGILADRGDVDQALHHRDTAYGLRNLVIERAPRARANVLVLTTSDSGNVPHKYLLPLDRYTRIDWFIEYARDGQAAELPPYDLVFNIIGDPDYADATEAPVAAFLQQCDRRVLNDPARVARTRRDLLPALLSGIGGLAMPKVARFEAAALAGRDLAAVVGFAGLTAPLLIRPIGSHGGRGLTLARTALDLEEVGGGGGLYATEYLDFRSPADGLYRKYRIIFVDRKPYPYHLAIADQWLVHYHTAGMPGDAERQAEELRFLADPRSALGDGAMAAVSAIGERLDLDYAGVDFSILPDGRVLVFEANATMLVHPEGEGEFAYKNPFVERITAAFQALIDRHSSGRADH